jgi:hypothetical protein
MTGPTFLREQAAKSRRLAKDISDEKARIALIALADDLDAKAVEIANKQQMPPMPMV